MYVKLFSTWDITTMEEAMNDFLEDMTKDKILNIDVKMAITYDQDQNHSTLYYTGIISYE